MSQKVEKLPVEPEAPKVSFEEMVPKIDYMPGALIWNNWHKSKPDPDRHVLLWINLGNLTRNFFLTYMDLQGNWDVPQGKNLTPFAWTYLTPPVVDQQCIPKAQEEVLADRAKAIETAKAQAAAQPKK